MQIFGHPYVPFTPFYRIRTLEQLRVTPPNTTVTFTFGEQTLPLIHHCREHRIACAPEVATLTEAALAENLGARYLIVTEALAAPLQRVAEHYLYDAKVLCRIAHESRIEPLLQGGVDGVIFAAAVVDV